MGGKNQTTTQQSTSTPTGAPQLYDIWNRVKDVASQPYTPFGGQMVAGLSPTQQAGIAGISGAQGSAQPYFDQAASYAKTGASAIDPSAIQRYMSPYTQNVIDSTQRQFDQSNAVQQNQVVGNAAARGALGGDRVAVAQAETARQQKLAQDPTIAGLYSNAYGQALGAAQQDRSAAAQGAYTFGALAPSVQNAKISGAQAQIGAGGLEQGTEQARLTAAYNQYLQQLAFPYQQAGFLASAGLPAVTNLGGQTSGTTTKPGPSPWGQIIGGGLTAASFMMPGKTVKRGGRIKARRYADGGPVNFFDVPSYVPRFGGVSLQSPFGSAPALPKIPDDVKSDMPSNQQIAGGMKGLKSLFGGMGGQAEGGNYDLNMAGDGFMTPSGFLAGGVKRGGRINPRMARFHDTVHAIRQTLRSGGAVRGYADGGTIDLSPSEYVNRGFLDTRDAVDSGAFDPQGANAPGPMAFSPPTAPAIPLPRPRPDDAPQGPYGLPPQITQGPDAEALPDNAMAFDATQRSPYALRAPEAADAASPSPDAPAKPGGGLFGNPFGLSDDARMGLRSAGLGMLASQSPFALSAIGEGGLQGMKTYADRLNHRQTVESEARKLAQQASQFAQNLGLHKDQLSSTDRRHGETLAETKRYHSGMLERENNKFIGTNEEGFPVYVNTRTGEETTGTTKLQGKAPAGYVRNPDGTMAPIKGGPAEPEHAAAVAKAKSTGGVLPDDTAAFLADRILAGDNKALTNLGRGAQGAENVIKVQTLVAQKAAQKGMDPSDILAKVAEQSGLSATQRTFGTQTAKMAVNATEAEGAIELGRTASAAVPRTNWVPVNKAIQAYQSGTSDPALAKFGAANLAIINTYARAINPNGVGTVHDKEHAEKMLSTAMGRDAYLAVLDQMNAEIDIAHKAAPKAKQELERLRKSGSATPDATGTSGVPKIGDRKQFKQGWGVWDGTKYAPEKP